MDTFAFLLPGQKGADSLYIYQKQDLNLVMAWFAATLTTTLLCLFALLYFTQVKAYYVSNQDLRIYTAVPVNPVVVEDYIEHQDGRQKIIEKFFGSHKSILADYSQVFVSIADKYQLDYRLLPAIAMQESNGGKRVIKNSHNPFGFGIYGSKVIKFNSWEEAIEMVGKALREDYLDQGLKNPYQIMTKYTPPSLEKGGAWAIGVSHFMSELD